MTDLSGSGAKGFVFEELMDQTLRGLVAPLAGHGISARLLNEQQIRDEFAEQSLNGVDHFLELTWASDGHQMLFLLQEKWKIITNQREVSQFLDCCARILARMPDFTGRVVRLWVTRTSPTLNGERSLTEGGAFVVQSSTSMCFLAQEAAQVIAEILGLRSAVAGVVAAMPPLLSGDAPQLEAPPKVKGSEKNMAGISLNAAKVKVCVVRRS